MDFKTSEVNEIDRVNLKLAYILPANSVYIKNNSECPFFELERSIAKYSRLGEIIMMGDFNARKGKLLK